MGLFNLWKSLFDRPKKSSGKSTRKTKTRPKRKAAKRPKEKIKKSKKVKARRAKIKKKPQKKPKKIKKKPAKARPKIKRKAKKPKKTERPPKPSRIKPAKPAPREREIGVITHYFSNISVAVIKLSGSLRVGDKIHIKGAHDDFTEVVKSMQVNHQNVAHVARGQEAGLKVSQRVHENDKVYLVASR